MNKENKTETNSEQIDGCQRGRGGAWAGKGKELRSRNFSYKISHEDIKYSTENRVNDTVITT